MRIGVDFDGVIVDTTRVKQRFCKEQFRIDIPENFISGGGAKKFLMPEQYQKLKDFDFGEGTLLGSVVPYAKQMIEQLVADGHKIVIVTGRHDVGAQYA